MDMMFQYMLALCQLIGCGVQATTTAELEAKMEDIKSSYEANGVDPNAGSQRLYWMSVTAQLRSLTREHSTEFTASTRNGFLNTLDAIDAEVQVLPE